jgi:hypothetical protein
LYCLELKVILAEYGAISFFPFPALLFLPCFRDYQQLPNKRRASQPSS